jgi:hypothetical protein
MTYKGIGDMANQSHGKRSGDVAVSRSIGETLFWDTRLKGWERREGNRNKKFCKELICLLSLHELQ